jgi:hypothetical protein
MDGKIVAQIMQQRMIQTGGKMKFPRVKVE